MDLATAPDTMSARVLDAYDEAERRREQHLAVTRAAATERHQARALSAVAHALGFTTDLADLPDLTIDAEGPDALRIFAGDLTFVYVVEHSGTGRLRLLAPCPDCGIEQEHGYDLTVASHVGAILACEALEPCGACRDKASPPMDVEPRPKWATEILCGGAPLTARLNELAEDDYEIVSTIPGTIPGTVVVIARDARHGQF